MLLGYSITVFKFAISHAIKVGIYNLGELHDISAKFTTKFNLKKLKFKNFLGNMLTYALNFAVYLL